MPREPRKLSESGLYHVTIRGNNKDTIFLEAEDYTTYLNYVLKARKKAEIEIHAYCLMSNHIHFLLKAQDGEALITFFTSLGAGFVAWYNKKYNRIGHLFQGRFNSKPIEDDDYYLAVIRYIHQNPVKAGYCKNILDYPYSSIYEYKQRARICDVRFALAYFGEPWFSSKTRRAFIRSQSDSADQVVNPNSDKTKRNMNLEEIIDLFQEVCTHVSWEERHTLSKTELIELAEYFKSNGVSYLQIEKYLGLTRYALKKLGI